MQPELHIHIADRYLYVKARLNGPLDYVPDILSLL
jgi:hypothetical protein